MCSPLKIFLYNSLLELQYLLKKDTGRGKKHEPISPHTRDSWNHSIHTGDFVVCGHRYFHLLLLWNISSESVYPIISIQ